MEHAVKVLVLGATGLLGNAMFRSLSRMPGAQVTGTVRQDAARKLFDPADAGRLAVVGNIEDPGQQAELFETVRPDVVVNCIAVGRPAPADPMRSVAIYGVLPQRLSYLCSRTGARLVQISSDGVFAGHRGGYTEADVPDADDVYGTSKFLGEVDAPYAVTPGRRSLATNCSPEADCWNGSCPSRTNAAPLLGRSSPASRPSCWRI